MGAFLFLAGLSAGCRIGILLCRSYLHDHWLWRSGVNAALANVRTNRGIDGNSHVRSLDLGFLRGPYPADRQLGERKKLVRAETPLKVSFETKGQSSPPSRFRLF